MPNMCHGWIIQKVIFTIIMKSTCATIRAGESHKSKCSMPPFQSEHGGSRGSYGQQEVSLGYSGRGENEMGEGSTVAVKGQRKRLGQERSVLG